jgi:hypothetical protein
MILMWTGWIYIFVCMIEDSPQSGLRSKYFFSPVVLLFTCCQNRNIKDGNINCLGP